jgi:tetratricopeptide (TPR) repeat protein
MLTLHQGLLKKLRMSWFGSRGVVRSYADKRLWRSRQTGSIRQLVFALSACLTVLGVTGDLARAEDPLSGKILSACRVPPREAYGEIRKPSPESKKGYPFILAATRFKFTGDYDQAIEQIDQAIKLDPANPRFYSERGIVRGANHQFREAVEDLDRAISLDPGSSVAFLERGVLYASMGEFGHTIEDYDEAIKLFPANARGYLLRGIVYLDKREYDRAIEDFDQSIKLDPLCPSGFNARGFAYDLKGQRDRAMADYDRAIELDPDPGNAFAFVRRASAFQAKRDYDRAIQDLGQALKLEPRNARALNNRCFIRAIAGAFDSALADCNEALQIRPRDPSFLDSRAFVYLARRLRCRASYQREKSRLALWARARQAAEGRHCGKRGRYRDSAGHPPGCGRLHGAIRRKVTAFVHDNVTLPHASTLTVHHGPCAGRVHLFTPSEGLSCSDC